MSWLSSGGKAAWRCAVLVLLLSCLVSCSNNKEPVVIWTDRQEFASYAELFNAAQDAVKVVVVYKESPVAALPPDRDQQPPDLVVGSWLRNDTTIKQFRPLDYLFTRRKINKSLFYPQLLDYGSVQNRQYLLPVSFNLPAIIFAAKNSHLVTENHLLTLDQIRDIASKFNRKGNSNVHTAMGFAPSWSPDFLYIAAQLKGGNFRGSENSLMWSQEKLELVIDYLHQWTQTVNDSIQEERDFAFKYLYTPKARQVLSGSCLFAYTTSSQLFSTPQNLLKEIGFRWVHQDNRIPVEDDIVFMGIHRNSRNTAGAEAFVSWFMQEESQHQMMERATIMDLSISTFGIAGGFSAMQNVTERVFPIYCKPLLDNVPAAQYIVPPTSLLPRWEGLKDRVIIPWLSDAAAAKDLSTIMSLEQRLAEWSKQHH